MDVETCVIRWYLFKTEKKIFLHFLPFFWHFFQPSLAPKLLKFSVKFFFQWAEIQKWADEHAFQLYNYSLRLYIDSDPPAFLGLIQIKCFLNVIIWNIKNIKSQFTFIFLWKYKLIKQNRSIYFSYLKSNKKLKFFSKFELNGSNIMNKWMNKYWSIKYIDIYI